ncbi:hypothetical protein Vadar_027282 [Vaccinium darrowii]|uniref:Uncharacterized protein n=1 Tax=Vaccinium darrowii TaxID=229202 RepID=A0ACB7X451_9ERIC|nr:hypothetical protein Vadar_027282 [Vaccinium darrowii]
MHRRLSSPYVHRRSLSICGSSPTSVYSRRRKKKETEEEGRKRREKKKTLPVKLTSMSIDQTAGCCYVVECWFIDLCKEILSSALGTWLFSTKMKGNCYADLIVTSLCDTQGCLVFDRYRLVLLEYDSDDNPREETVKPMVDGGIEGFKVLMGWQIWTPLVGRSFCADPVFTPWRVFSLSLLP